MPYTEPVFLSWLLKKNLKPVAKETFADSVGLLGSYPDGKKLARDGSTVLEDVNQFGQEWQVLPSEPKLFSSYEGAVPSTMQCAMPKKIEASEKRRRLGASAITRDDATLACAHVDDSVDNRDCIHDVLATNNMDIAGAY